MYLLKIILFHFTAYPIDTLILIFATVSVFLFLKKTGRNKYIQKTIGFFILFHIFIFWGDSFSTGIGTGSFVNSNTIITNEHVANKACTKITIIDNGIKYSGQYIDGLIEKGVDLSYIRVLGANKKTFVAISSHNAKINEQVFFPDYDAKNLGKLDKSTGILKDYRPTGEFYIKSNNARPGNSGSPIINSNGGLVGVLWGGSWLSHFVHSKGNGGDAVSNSRTSVIELAKKNSIKLYQAPNKKYYSGNIDNFIDEVSVSIICEIP
jgi:S1-C subfamily serine protease